MLSLIRQINHKINSLIWSFISAGVVLLIMAVLIVWTDFMLRFVMGLLVITIAYTFIFAGYKLWLMKKEIEDRYSIFKEIKAKK
jgi:hypothetical protein